MFKSSDLYYSAYLLSIGIPFLGLEKQYNRFYFLFGETPTEQQVFEYNQSSALVSVRLYIDSLRLLKTKIHGE